MTAADFEKMARELRDYIDARYHEFDEDEIDGMQLVPLVEGAILKMLRRVADAENEAIEKMAVQAAHFGTSAGELARIIAARRKNRSAT